MKFDIVAVNCKKRHLKIPHELFDNTFHNFNKIVRFNIEFKDRRLIFLISDKEYLDKCITQYT